MDVCGIQQDLPKRQPLTGIAMSGIGLNGKDHQPNHGNQELATPGFTAIGTNKTKDGADHGTQELVTPESLTATGTTAIGMNKMRSSMEISDYIVAIPIYMGLLLVKEMLKERQTFHNRSSFSSMMHINLYVVHFLYYKKILIISYGIQFVVDTWSARKTWTPKQILDKYRETHFKISQRTSSEMAASCDGTGISVISESAGQYGTSSRNSDQANMLDFCSLRSGFLSNSYDARVYTCTHHLETLNRLLTRTGNAIWIAAELSYGHYMLLDGRSGNLINSWQAHDGYVTKVWFCFQFLSCRFFFMLYIWVFSSLNFNLFTLYSPVAPPKQIQIHNKHGMSAFVREAQHSGVGSGRGFTPSATAGWQVFRPSVETPHRRKPVVAMGSVTRVATRTIDTMASFVSSYLKHNMCVDDKMDQCNLVSLCGVYAGILDIIHHGGYPTCIVEKSRASVFVPDCDIVNCNLYGYLKKLKVD
ncbi:hypothetical protein LXL04_001681 [Taraxacum kok-saghyz]